MAKQLILCDCSGSMPLDAERFASVDGVQCSRIHTGLCMQESAQAAEKIAAGNALITCGQEQAFFTELAAEIGAETPQFVDLRDRAGWSNEAGAAGPKMAALTADALRVEAPVKTMDVTSEGLCLILGDGEAAIAAAEQLADSLSVTLLMAEPPEDLPQSRAYDLIAGQLKRAKGAIGNFEVTIDGLRQLERGGRGAMQLGAPRDGGQSLCDIILDLRGTQPLFPAHEKRDGYLRADPGRAEAVADAVFQASHLVGTFEKPLHVALTPHLCAHSRAEKQACSKCLDICPTGAIFPAGEHVDVDPLICAGCGACSALCPSGAIALDDPAPAQLFARMTTLVETYRAAGGAAPRLLVHDRDFGAEMIRLAARFGAGLPADVLPLDLERVSGFGHAEMLAARAAGFVAVDVLMAPTTERSALETELTLARALQGSDIGLRLLDPQEPDALTDLLYGAEVGAAPATPILPLGSRRQVTRLATKALQPEADTPISLPVAAPYGAVLVDTDACTLCLSCAGLCPAGALGDNPDAPQLRFQEDACLQCGLCANVCPENAITLKPQLDLSEAALSQRVLHEEEPYDCIECGKPFGVRSTIERIVEKLGGKHSMFASEDATRMIRMCDDCRVNAQYHSTNNPFEMGERPRVRTTDDYLSKRRDH